MGEERYINFMRQKYGERPCEWVNCAWSTADDQYAVFKDNVMKAHHRNLKSTGNVYHGITNLMDLTSEEFNGLLGYKAPEGYNEDVKPEDVLALQPLASSKTQRDWRTEGAVTPVKDQGQCGSCWAFSATEEMESAALVQGLSDPSDPFIGAPQELVSCDTHGMDQGCNGGLPSNAFKYYKKVPLEPEEDYPYTSGVTKRSGTCKLDKSEGVYEIDTTTPTSIWGIGEKQDMTDYVLEKGPISIAVAANDAWQTYQGGVIGLDECPDAQVNHAVQAVGVVTGGEQPYWIVRNSWAAGWGEDGYIRVAYGNNVCNIAADTYGVTVKKVDMQDEVVV